MAAVGVDLLRDANQICERVKKFSDIAREYARLARSRGEFAKEAESESHFKTAEENYLAVPRIMATDSCFKVAVVISSCHEPGMETIFQLGLAVFQVQVHVDGGNL